MIKPPWSSKLILTLFACAAVGTTDVGRAQIRSVTQHRLPTGGNSVAWIWNVPYVSGGDRHSNSIYTFLPNTRTSR